VAGRRRVIASPDLKRLNRVHAERLNVVFLPDISGGPQRIARLSRTRRQLLALFSEVDAVIVRLPTELGLEAGSLALATNKPLALDIGGCILDGLRAHGSFAGRLYAPIAYRRMRSLVGRASWVAYVTQTFLQARYPTAAGAHTVACSNVDLPESEPDLLEHRLSSIGATGRVLTFGTIGTLYTRYKGVQHAFAALEAAAPRLPVFRYRILGGGDQTPWRELSKRHGLADRVTFDGTLPSGQLVRHWLDSIDLYLQPSLLEGLPRALIEAMSRACPAVASDVGGISEVLPAEVLHPPGDAVGLAALIERAANPTMRSTLARQNWTRAQSFTKPKLDKLRAEFWGAFRDTVQKAVLK
jgi:glycosyltransferase involved in cell wall biosynthesis